MNASQKDAWILLKKAVDKYSQSTGAEVVVATKFYPVAALSENYMPQEVKSETAFYGHGSLTSQVRDALDPHKNESQMKGDWTRSGGMDIYGKTNYNTSQRGNKYPLSSSYRTLRLDFDPSQGKLTTPNNSNKNNDLLAVIPQSSGKKRLKKKVRDTDGELELDENLLFGEEEQTPSSDDDDSSDDSSRDNVGQLPSRRVINPNNSMAYTSRDQFATSLPVNINAFAWGNQSDSTTRFRNNQGPHPPTFNQTITGGQPRVIQAEQTPHPDTIMASMQALARSVTDDTALIFGERPRPRVFNESEKKRSAQQ